MFLQSDYGLDQAGGTIALPLNRSLRALPQPSVLDRLLPDLRHVDWAPDLGAQIGSRTWWRGAATCTALIAATLALAPGLRPVIVPATSSWTADEEEEARALSIAPLALGAASGRRMAANDLVRPLTETPERPMLELSATAGNGDGLADVLRRAGVSGADARSAERLVASSLADGLAPGTQLDVMLGRRASRAVPRPLERVAFRARFDLNLTVARQGDALTLQHQPIAIDHTPLHLQGLVGASLYRSVRAAGVPAGIIADYIRAITSKTPIGRGVSAADTFDLVIERARAATGETQLGDLQLAGLTLGDRRVSLVRWGGGDSGGETRWYEASGRFEQRGAMGMPIAGGRISSTYGMRFHPILGMQRMHKGLDIAAAWGTPIHAAMDGVVAQAGWSGGYGRFVKLASAGGLATGYGHMSRIAVRAGQRVARGDVIGYVGSTGLSTGPHLHWEVWRNGQAVNPRSISLSSVAALSGEELRRFRAKVATLLAIRPGN